MKNEGTTLKPRTARTMIILSLVLSGLSIHAENHEPRERGLEALLEPTIGKGVRVPAAPKLPPPTDNSQIKVTLDWEKCSGDKQVGRFGIQAYRPESGWNNLTRTGCRDSFVLLSVDGKLYHFGLSYNEGLSTAGWDQPRVNKKGNRMESTWVVNIPRPSGLQSFPVAVTQILETTASKPGGPLDTVLVKYRIENRDLGVAHQIGIRSTLDLTKRYGEEKEQLRIGNRPGYQDSLVISRYKAVSSPGVILEGEKEVRPTEKLDFMSVPRSVRLVIPPKGADPGIDTQLTLQTGLKDSVPPSRFSHTSICIVGSNLRDFTLPPIPSRLRDYQNAGCVGPAIYWNPRPYQPGETQTVAYGFGLGSDGRQ